MSVHEDLGLRMKEFYESVPKTRLMRRTPVMLRLDGKSFHTFTRGFQKPFDEVLVKSMQETMKYLCENIQGCVFGYTQSDEITLVLVDYKKLNSSAWFDYEVQKMCSIAASMATMAFNKFFEQSIINFAAMHDIIEPSGHEYWDSNENHNFFNNYAKAFAKGAMFDARAFNVPREEVTNFVYWRQLDATRNSIQMVGQANFSHKELQNKSCNMIQDMLFTQRDINWNDLPTHLKRGSCCRRMSVRNPEIDKGDALGYRFQWVIDTEIPIFKDEGRNYIEKLINFEED